MRMQHTMDQPSVTLDLPRNMHVTVRDDGSVTVRQDGREISPGLYDMGGEYELFLPDATAIGDSCSERAADPGRDDFPSSGTTTIEVTHRH